MVGTWPRPHLGKIGPSCDKSKLDVICQTSTQLTTALARADRPTFILGPLPRPDGELAGIPWSYTAAYKLERRQMTLNRDRRLGPGTQVWGLGRSRTKKIDRTKRLQDCWEYFLADAVHLSPLGYRRVTQCAAFLRWLRVRGCSEMEGGLGRSSE